MTQLGTLVWYSVPPMHVPISTVAALMDSLGIDEAMRPRPAMAGHAFLRLRSQLHAERRTIGGALVACVDKGRDGEERRFTFELRTGRHAGTEVGWAKFYYPNPRQPHAGIHMNVVMEFGNVPASLRPELEALKTHTDELFDQLCGHLDANKVRTIARNLLRRAHGLQLMESFFLVHASQLPAVEQVSRFLTGLGCPVHVLPQPEGPEVRALARDTAEAYLPGLLGWCVQEVNRTYEKRTRGVTMTAYEYVRGFYDLYMATSGNWSQWLDVTLPHTADAAYEAHVAMERLKADAR